MSALQMMSYLTLISLSFPTNLLAFLGYLESVHNFNKWLPNPFEYVFREKYLDLSPYNEQFADRGFQSRNMLYLCGSDLVMLAVMGLAILVLVPLSNVLRYRNMVSSLVYATPYSRSCVTALWLVHSSSHT